MILMVIKKIRKLLIGRKNKYNLYNKINGQIKHMLYYLPMEQLKKDKNQLYI